jgi:hypothetical protein
VEFIAPSGSFDGNVKFSTGDGLAQAVYTHGPTPGAVTIRASTLAGEVVLEFTAVGEIGTPTTFRAISGDAQTGAVEETLPLPLRVRVLNEFGVGYPGVPVLWAAQGPGGLSATAGVTDASGYAEVAFTLGSEPGAHTVTANVEGFFPVTFTAVAN